MLSIEKAEPKLIKDKAKELVSKQMIKVWENRRFAEDSSYTRHRPLHLKSSHSPINIFQGGGPEGNGVSFIKYSATFNANTQASDYIEHVRGYIYLGTGKVICTTRKATKHPINRRLDYTLVKRCRSIADIKSLTAEIFKEYNKHALDDCIRINKYNEVTAYLRSPAGPDTWSGLIDEMELKQEPHLLIDCMSDDTLDSCVAYVKSKLSLDINHWLDTAYTFKGDIIDRGAGESK